MEKGKTGQGYLKAATLPGTSYLQILNTSRKLKKILTSDASGVDKRWPGHGNRRTPLVDSVSLRNLEVYKCVTHLA